jgi:hypothetical protein
VEWNGDLGQYELLSDGATRGQFQQLLRTQQVGFNAAWDSRSVHPSRSGGFRSD